MLGSANIYPVIVWQIDLYARLYIFAVVVIMTEYNYCICFEAITCHHLLLSNLHMGTVNGNATINYETKVICIHIWLKWVGFSTTKSKV